MFNHKELKEIKDLILISSKKGFGYFIKNTVLLILIFIGLFILGNPEIIKNPVAYLETFDTSSIYGIGLLFCIICGIYQLGFSINNDRKNVRNKEIAKEVINEQQDDKKIEIATHVQTIHNRLRLGPEISNQLKSLLINLGADRASVIEMHNGSNNINGCPFVHATMNYEEISPNVDYISDEYKNFNLLKYPFVSKHFDEHIWVGSVDTVEVEDPYFASKLKFGCDKYICFQILTGRKGPFGFLSVSFSDNNYPSKSQIVAEVSRVGQVISNIIDNDVTNIN